MAPSNSRNTMTRPERTRPVQRAGLETGTVSAVMDMAFSCEVGMSGLRLQVDGGAEAAIHVERHRRMLVGDLPDAADLAETKRFSKPEIDFVTALLGACHAAQPEAVGAVAADDDREITHLAADRATPGGEPGRDIAGVIDTHQRRRQRILHIVGRPACDDAVDILCT